MCGIVVVVSESNVKTLPFDPILPRGPDGFTMRRVSDQPCVMMGHSRLATHKTSTEQPLQDAKWSLVCNGELYNQEEDCHALIPLLERGESLGELDGVFAFVAYHPVKGIVAARDPIGVVPLYVGQCEGQLWFASMERCLSHCDEVSLFPPGYECRGSHLDPQWRMYKKKYALPSQPTPPMELRQRLTEAVDKRIRTCSTTWGVFLSGGLDSSIVAALAARHGTIRTYSIGLEDSPDLVAAREVARFLGSAHTEVVFTIAEGLSVIPEVIRAVETCDITTVRASVPMYLLAKKVKRDGIRVMLSGEGSDELFSGYAYNRFAPSAQAIFDECVDKMDQLHAYDCQRANKSCAAWGIECRVPFLDLAVVDFAMNRMQPKDKMWRNMGKEFLREEFLGALPDHILMRKKAQFSDAVGKRWINACRSLFKEHEYYKLLYRAACPTAACLYELETVACSTAKGAQWVTAKRDPSGDIVMV